MKKETREWKQQKYMINARIIVAEVQAKGHWKCIYQLWGV